VALRIGGQAVPDRAIEASLVLLNTLRKRKAIITLIEMQEYWVDEPAQLGHRPAEQRVRYEPARNGQLDPKVPLDVHAAMLRGLPLRGGRGVVREAGTPGAVAAGVVRAAVAAVRPAAEAQVGVHAVAAVRRGAPSRRGRGRVDGEDSFGRRAHECARAQKEVAHAAPRLDGRKLEASEHFGLDRRALSIY